MRSENVYLDTKVLGSSQRVLSEAPLATSDPTIWSGVHAELHRQPPQHTPNHTTSSTVLCLHTGETLDMEWWVEGKYSKSQISYNQITLFPAPIMRSLRWQDEKGFLLLCLEDNFAATILGEENPFKIPNLVPQLGIHDSFIREVGQLLRRQLEEVNDDTLYIESLSLALGVYLTQHYSDSNFSIQVNENGLSRNQVRRIQDYIEAHLSDTIRLKDMAQLVDMSLFHFSRQFKQATHLAPYQFVIKTRLTRAKDFLRSHRTMNISDIAFRCGFSSQSHFAYHFRKAEGVSPKTYRQDFD